MDPITGMSIDKGVSIEEDFLDFHPFYILPEDMGKLLYVACGPTMRKDTMGLHHCDDIMKALIIYVANTPDICQADDLFELDQVSDVGVQQDFPQWKHNWQWVLSYTRYNTGQTEGEILVSLAIRKSVAVKIGRLVGSDFPDNGPHHRFAQVVAFWLVKLYQARGADMTFLPPSLQFAYRGFLQWKGVHWDILQPTIPFTEVIMQANGVSRTIFSKAKELRHQDVYRRNWKYTARLLQIEHANPPPAEVPLPQNLPQTPTQEEAQAIRAQINGKYFNTTPDIASSLFLTYLNPSVGTPLEDFRNQVLTGNLREADLEQPSSSSGTDVVTVLDIKPCFAEDHSTLSEYHGSNDQDMERTLPLKKRRRSQEYYDTTLPLKKRSLRK